MDGQETTYPRILGHSRHDRGAPKAPKQIRIWETNGGTKHNIYQLNKIQVHKRGFDSKGDMGPTKEG